jgi:magnesium chelatase family protein
MLAKVKSVSLKGLEEIDVIVEVDISRGLPSFNIVGLPDEAVQESRERVRSAIKNAGFEFPMQRITVNLAPAEVRKVGAVYDLPIAIGILVATEAIHSDNVNEFHFAGELSLDGSLRKISGALPMAIGLSKKDAHFVLPFENSTEVEIISGVETYPVKHLHEAVEFLNGDREIVSQHLQLSEILNTNEEFDLDFSDIKGQYQAKRAMEIAAAGGHNIAMMGTPGCGKTLLARRLPTILPPLSEDEAIEVTQIYSVAGLLKDEIIKQRPFRSPHHTASSVAIIGGGRTPKPGEISLAHHGVLFLDELPEFKRDVLEVLRQPLEDGFVTIARVKETIVYPSRFMLVAAMNPCPCGWYGDPVHPCSCSIYDIKRYRSKISGPLWDRFDIQIEVPRLLPEELAAQSNGERSSKIRERVIEARDIQLKRYNGTGIFSNAGLTPHLMKKFIKIGEEERNFLVSAAEKLGITGRGYDRILRVARTIADLDHDEKIRLNHIAEALQYRVDLSVQSI